MRALFNLARRSPLPAAEPVDAETPNLRGANLAAVYYGVRKGGDFHDFVRVGPTRVLFGLLDVAGRREENQDTVAAAQNTFRSVGPELFSDEDVNPADAMIELCLQLNGAILKSSGKICSSPAFVGCYDETLGTVVYFNAGHTPGLVRDHLGVTELPATGLPLGLFSHTTCDASVVFLQPGAVLLLVSRGVVEAKRGNRELGLDEVKKGLYESGATNSKELCLSVLDQVQQFTRVSPTHNDITALALTRAAAMKLVSVAGG